MLADSRSLLPPDTSFFLFGPRGVGKSTWLRRTFKFDVMIDLLNQREYLDLSRDPHLLYTRLEHLAPRSWVCIDEVQKIPELLNEVHALIEDKKIRFALSGSSACKLKRGGANLLGGRAITCQMEGFTSHELKQDHDLNVACEWGTLPLVVTSAKNKPDILSSYVHTYLKEEIQAEGLVRQIGTFHRFLEIAGIINAQTINIENLARDSGTKRRVVEDYLSILEDTLLCHRLTSYQPKVKVREASHAKWYWFDPGVARACAGFLYQPVGADWLGFALETIIFHELRVYNSFAKKKYRIAFYQTPTSEIDFVIETRKPYHSQKAEVVCLEVKWSEKWKREWENPIRSLASADKINVKRMLGLYRGKNRLTFDGFEVWPVEEFLQSLHSGEIF